MKPAPVDGPAKDGLLLRGRGGTLCHASVEEHPQDKDDEDGPAVGAGGALAWRGGAGIDHLSSSLAHDCRVGHMECYPLQNREAAWCLRWAWRVVGSERQRGKRGVSWGASSVLWASPATCGSLVRSLPLPRRVGALCGPGAFFVGCLALALPLPLGASGGG